MVARWLSILQRRRAAPLLLAFAAIGTFAVLACVAVVITGLLIAPQIAEEEAPLAAASDTPAPTPDLYVSPLAAPTSAAVQPEPTTISAGQPAEQAAAVPTDSTLWVSPIDTPPSDIPVGAGGPGTEADAPLLIEPIDVPGPTDSLQLIATSPLTLSSIIFIENRGQFPAPIRFAARGAPGGSLWLTDSALWMVLLEADTAPGPSPAAQPGAERDTPAAQRGAMLKLSFPGANARVRAEPFQHLDTQVSYLSGGAAPGSDPAAPAWGGVRYTDLYPGIDLELSSQGDVYTQRLIVDPGADLDAVRLQVEGAQDVAIQPLADAGGGYYLEVTTELGVFALPLFVVDSSGGALTAPSVTGPGLIQSPFTPTAGDLSALTLGAPPGLLHVNRAGIGGGNVVHDVAVDAAGSAYLAGSTYFPRAFQAPGPFDVAAAGHYEAFALHLSPGGKTLMYATFLGGSGDEIGSAIAIDGTGGAYLAGSTTSSDLPMAGAAGPGLPVAFDTTRAGDEDLFLAKLEASGTSLVYATYLGGQGRERVEDVAVDGAGNAYLAGWTESSDFPVTQGAWQTQHVDRSGFLVKVNAPGSGLAYATLIDGKGADQAQAVAVDQNGLAYVAGVTSSDDLPLTPGTYDGTLGGGSDAFVAIVNATGTAPLYATLFGGAAEDAATGVGVDVDGIIHLGGYTRSADLPVTSWAAQPGPGGSYDGFLARVDPAAGLLSGTYIGGSGDDWVQAVAVDTNGRACAAGSTASTDLTPGRAGQPLVSGGGFDALVVCFDNLGFAPTYAALLGGSGDDHARALAINRVGTTYVVATTTSAAGGSGRMAGTHSVVGKLVVGSPFLDLPVHYSNFSRAALGNVGDRGPGRVNSWFDHSAPTHARNRSLTRWDGVTTRFDTSSLPRIGESWYDGHGGIDFRRDSSSEPIFAAAPGRVVDTMTTCRVGQPACGGGFGNRVWIDHGNGFATVYGHLESVDVTVGTIIVDTTAQQLGIMGNTGRSFGTHLHFALYFDTNGDGQWTSDEVADPYGWLGSRADPWRGHSQYLWRNTLFAQQIVGETALDPAAAAAQTFLASPSRFVSITIPADAVAEPTLIELWDMPPADEPSASWRSTGRSLLLTGTTLATGEAAPAPARPITLTMAIRQGDLVHLDPQRLALRRWDESSEGWQTLEGRIDPKNDRVVAYTTAFGRFDLHAPLLCPDDSQEPDDHYGAAQTIPADGSRVRRVFDIHDDIDWLRFEGEAGETYLISARALAAGLRLDFKIYDPDSIRQLAASKDGQYLEWVAPTSGSYLVRIAPVGDGPRGCGAAYELRVGSLRAPKAVEITGPQTGMVGEGYAFAASLTPLTVTEPITYVWQVSTETPGGLPPSTFTSGADAAFSYTWTTAATYWVQVAVTNAAGTVTATHAIQILPPLEASFSASQTKGPAPLKVKFTDTSVGLYSSRRWQFGDGETSDADTPSHTYATPGTYTVTLQIGGEGGEDTATRVAYITVEAAPTPIPVKPNYDVRIYLPFISR